MSQDLKDFKLVLSGTAPQRVIIAGSAYAVLSSTSPVKLAFDNDSGRTIERKAGDTGKTGNYTEVWVYSDVPQTVVLGLGHGEASSSSTVTVENVQATIQNANVNNHQNAVTVTAGQTVPLIGGAPREELRIQVRSDQPGGVFIGGAGVGNEQGGFIEVGMVDYLTSEGAFYAYNPGAEDVIVNLLSLERV